MNNTENDKIIKAIHDLKSALDSLAELNDRERAEVITAVFGAEAVNRVIDIYTMYLKR